jgi:hypothetical protein
VNQLFCLERRRGAEAGSSPQGNSRVFESIRAFSRSYLFQRHSAKTGLEQLERKNAQ